MKAQTTKKNTKKSPSKSRPKSIKNDNAQSGETNSAISASTEETQSKSEVQEAARILKSGGSKKRERRRAAAVMSQFGSRKGGLNRARNLSPEKLKEIATLGGLARQAKARQRAANLAQTNSPNAVLEDAAR